MMSDVKNSQSSKTYVDMLPASQKPGLQLLYTLHSQHFFLPSYQTSWRQIVARAYVAFVAKVFPCVIPIIRIGYKHVRMYFIWDIDADNVVTQENSLFHSLLK